MARPLVCRSLLVAAALAVTVQNAPAQPEGHGVDFRGVYRVDGPLLAVGPCDGRINGRWDTGCSNYPYTEAGRDLSIPAVENGSVDCVPDALVRLNMRTLYSIQLSHEPSSVLIKYQFGDVVRTIHLDGRAPPPDAPHTLHGYSVGRWMGDMLYIETTNLSPSFFSLIGGAAGTRIGGPTSDSARVTERWWPSPNAGNLLMDMVLDDPVYYERPVLLVRREWIATDATGIEPWDCVSASDVLLTDDPDLDAFFAD